MVEFIAHVVKVFKRPKYITDSLSTFFVYRVLVLLLVVAYLVTSYYNTLGTNIRCNSGNEKESLMETYCGSAGVWVYGEAQNSKKYRRAFTFGFHTGRDMRVTVFKNPAAKDDLHEEHNFVLRHIYYWTMYLLLPLLNFLPRFFWGRADGGYVAEVVQNHNNRDIDEIQIEAITATSARIFAPNIYNHKYFVRRYLCSLVVYLLSLVSQAVFVIKYVGNGYISIAVDGLRYYESTYEHYPYDLALAFPQRVSCIYKSVSAGGNRVPSTGLCELPHSTFHQLSISVYFFYLLVSALMIFGEILWILLQCASPRLARYRARRNVNVDHERVVGQVIARLGPSSCIFIGFLSKNLSTLRLVEILRGVRLEMNIGLHRLRRQARGDF